MRLRIIFSFLLIFAFSQTLFASAELKRSDVRQVIEQLLDYHIDHKELNSEILKRSFKVFVKQFDSKSLYLLHSEIDPYLNPKEKKLQTMLEQYQEKSEAFFEHYQGLYNLITKAIDRSRQWRSEWSADDLFRLAEDRSSFDLSVKWSRYKRDLKSRIQDHYLAFIQSNIGLKKSKDLPDFKTRVLSLYERRLAELENEYLFLDLEGKALPERKKEHLFVLRVIKAIAKSLDSHTSFFSSQEAYDMRVQLEKNFHGIGVILKEDIHGPTITRLIEGGPAERSGSVKVEDTIVEIDGKNVRKYPFKKVLELIRGEKGSKISLGLQRLSKNKGKSITQVRNVELTRGKVLLDEKRVDVSYESFADGIIGKIKLYSFYEGKDLSSEKDVREAIKELKSKGNLKGLVLDLRENLGGFLMQAVKVAGLFLSNGVVVVAKYSDGESKYFRDVDGYTYFDGPLLVLTSKASASAAEIVAQTLQDYGKALVVGDEHTYGKGSIQHQTVTDKSSWAFFKVTVGRYYTASGKSTQIQGVLADIVVPTNYHNRQIGERHLEYPLPSDDIEPSYQDLLSDLDWDSKRWYMKYYIPSLQKPVDIWKQMLPTLRKNSEERISTDKNFSIFLEKEASELKADKENYGVEDLQMQEAVHIIKDMIFIQSQKTALIPK